jgi:hypothetical protein
MNSFLRIFAIVLLFVACAKEESINCEQLKSAIAEDDQEAILSKLSDLTKKMEPQNSCSDLYGHAINLNLLVEELNVRCEDLLASVECYSCIYTNPPQSEIKIAYQGFEIVVDIQTPEDGPMEPIRVH